MVVAHKYLRRGLYCGHCPEHYGRWPITKRKIDIAIVLTQLRITHCSLKAGLGNFLRYVRFIFQRTILGS